MLHSFMMLILAIALGIAAYFDLKYKEVSGVYLLVLWGVLFLLRLVDAEGDILSVVLGELVGIMMILLSFLCKKSIGMADGVILCITGLVMGGIDNITLLMNSLLIGVIYCIFLMIFRSYKRKSTIPFIPCIFLAYMGSVVI